MKFLEDAKLKAQVWLRERKEKAEAKKALHAAVNSEHGHGRFFLLTVPATATICAAVVEVYWAFLFCIEATGHLAIDWATAVGSDTAPEGAWHFAFVVNSVAVLLGLVCATVPIVMISMVWLPVQFTMRGTGAWRRGTMIFCGLLANLLVIVSGTVVMNGNRQEQVREGVVVEQTAAQGRAAIDARLAFEQEQLRLALNNTNPYLNQAANVGAAEWERSYVAQARATNDPRLPQLERALGAARAADERRANIERLTVERAIAAPEAATATVVDDRVGAELNAFAQAVEVWRPPFVALICTLVGIFGSWWVLALMQGLNPRDVLRSGWADESHRIEDLREQEPVASHPVQMQTVMEEEDLNTGEKRRMVTPKPYWRTVKKGQKQRVEIPPEVEADEVGVSTDGGNRIAQTPAGPIDLDNPGVAPLAAELRVEAEPTATEGDQNADTGNDVWRSLKTNENANTEDGNEDGAYDRDTGDEQDDAGSLQSSDTIQPDLPDLTDDDAQFLEEAQDEREPETDPAKLIAAE